MFMKFSYFLFMLICFCLNFLMMFFGEFCLNIDYYTFMNDMIMNLNFSFFIGMDSIIFITMVTLVSILVCSFSEIYLEWYDNKKYFFLMFFFYLAMFVLVISASPMTLLLGWDFLGIVSIFLIMYYPNVVNLSNSLWTMIFNRMGDIFLIFCLCNLYFNSCFFYWFFMDKLNMFLLISCSFTKSAQFPLSTWLPLAMSAPTPISAMVHSSTLVTAGIFILSKFLDMFYEFYLFNVVKLFSCLTFLGGGFMACLEEDFKKIIAFSTMSQISMMIFFLTFNLKMLSFFHMFLHALFKSLLFSCTGMGFFLFMMDQNKFYFNLKNYSKMLKVCMFLSIFYMTGLVFSLSFFSKDFLLEWLYSSFGVEELFMFLLIGSAFTLMYCSILSESLKSYSFSKSFSMFKNFSTLFYLLALVSMMLFLFVEFFFMFPLINSIDVVYLNMFFFLFLMVTISLNFKFMKNLSLNILFMNTMMELLVSSYKKMFSKIFFSEFLFLENYYVSFLMIESKVFDKKSMIFYTSLLVMSLLTL